MSTHGEYHSLFHSSGLSYSDKAYILYPGGGDHCVSRTAPQLGTEKGEQRLEGG